MPLGGQETWPEQSCCWLGACCSRQAVILDGGIGCLAPRWSTIPVGTRYVLESHGVGATVHGWLFVADVSIDLELTNRGPGPLYIDTSLLRAVDARGSNLRMIEGCRVPEGIRRMPVVLNVGESSRVERAFAASPFFGLRRNPDLKVITLFIDGMTRAGQPIPLQITLEWE